MSMKLLAHARSQMKSPLDDCTENVVERSLRGTCSPVRKRAPRRATAPLGHTGSTVLFGCALATLTTYLPAMASSFSTSASVFGDCLSQSTTGTTSASLFEFLTSCPDGNLLYAAALAQSNGTVSVVAEFASAALNITSPLSLMATATLTDTLTFSSANAPPGTVLGTGFLTATVNGGLDFVSEGSTLFSPGTYASFAANIYDPVNSVGTSGMAEFCPSPPGTTAQSVAPRPPPHSL